MAYDLEDIRAAYEYDTNAWQPIRDEAKVDMRFVAGDPWDADDKEQRKNRPTVAPEEMSQYRNQVINALMQNPRGAKFAPIANGASQKTAEFYQNKWREVEYRSNATQAYLQAADNALQRSYGFLRVKVDYANPRSVNQEIAIEGFPNPDMVLPDTDALRYDGGDMTRCFVHKWVSQRDFKRDHPKAKITNFGDFQSNHPTWIQGDKVLLSEHWAVQTRPRALLLVQPKPPPMPGGQMLPPQAPELQPVQIFKDELEKHFKPDDYTVLRELRTVAYPDVFMYLTNGLEVLHTQKWLGKYIPIVSCYGKVLYLDGDAGMKRVILSMTRFGRDPWKSYCYACSQELEVLSQVPKAPLQAWAGQLRGYEKDWTEAPHNPKAYLLKHHKDETGQMYPELDARVDYLPGQYLQGIEMVKEGFRRAIQASMGSNFLPTQAQQRNEKSGVALDKIDQVATQGTYHFVYAYEGMIRRAAEIGEDLMDKIHDYRGETGVIAADGKASHVKINDPNDEEAVSTKGDHLVTISTGPSTDSEREAVADFIDNALIKNMAMIVQMAGPKVGAAIFARAVRMRNLGPQGDELASLIEPPEFAQKDGQPPNPALMGAQAQIQHLTQLLQQAAQEKQAKVVEQQGKLQIEQMKVSATSDDKEKDREVKLAIAELGARVDRLALFLQESRLVGARHHDLQEAHRDRTHEAVEALKNRAHEHLQNVVDHVQEVAAIDRQAQHDQIATAQQAALAPQPPDDAGDQ